MPLYIGDYLRDTMHLSTEQHGAYFLLLIAYWNNGGPLPDIDEYLSSITKLCRPDWEEMRPTMESFFEVGNGWWSHKRVEAELYKANSLAESKIRAGKAGMAKRWGNTASNTPITDGLQNDNGGGVHSHSHSQGEYPPTPLNGKLTVAERITLEKELDLATKKLEKLRKNSPYPEGAPQLKEIEHCKFVMADTKTKLGIRI